VGNFLDDKWEGKGTVNYKDGTSYEGMFSKGQYEGDGILKQ
jgi:hypothetical protein